MRRVLLSLLFLMSPLCIRAQVTAADYERANGLRERYQWLTENVAERANWIGTSHRFWYRKTVAGGHNFFVYDAETLSGRPAFDHNRLAEALQKLDTGAKEKPTAARLPFTEFTFVDNDQSIEFNNGPGFLRCSLQTYTCQKIDPPQGRGGQRNAGIPITQGIPGPHYTFPQTLESKPSPDGKLEAYISNFNIWVRSKGKRDGKAISFDGSEGNYYALASLEWSPDSKALAVYRVRPGYGRRIQYVESSPAEQEQPRYYSMEYAKPGDVLDLPQPMLFKLDSSRPIPIDATLFPNPYNLTRIEWRKDSRAFTFEYNQRGHQVYRVLEVDAATGSVRSLISEEPKTFFCYSSKKYRQDIGDGKEMVWMSERDGWNHLYLVDGKTGQVRNQITRGQWVVRGVDKVDEEKRQIWFQASGMYPGKDPYFIHYYRINFDGTGLTALTEADGNHLVTFSRDMKFYVDNWSRVDLPNIAELKSADGKVLARVETGNIEALAKAGWKAPEVFTALGRDGKTEIWGVIYRPQNFSPSMRYPVVENIYAGPHSSFVPKTFTPYNPMQSLAELGFIVVQIDGMGTSNRSKAFHDVAWKNIGDAGFPDRILWHQAVAAKYPYYDTSRVGIYGTSAGGQNSLGALLFHPEFYKVCVSACGCHDNRMDKIWWNEQWMGWPLGPEYIASSNVENAGKLQGDLLLILGEMDTNVDPASTMQVVNALIKSEKQFDLLVIPGANHGSGGAYGDRKRYDFFVHHLLKIEPPDWNKSRPAGTK